MGQGVKSVEYTRFYLCRMFHWTYEEYESQPAFFIEDILLCLQQEANKDKQQNIKAARGRGIPRNG